MEHVLKVNICGEPLSIRSDQPQDVVVVVANYLNGKVRAAAGDGIQTDKFRLLALVAMGITAELMELKTKLEETDQNRHEMLAQVKSLTETLDRALTPIG